MAGAYYYLKNREKPLAAAEATATAEFGMTTQPQVTPSYLFSAEDGLPNSIRLQAHTGEVVELARNDENAWVVRRPLKAAADQGSSEAAASQITTISITSSVPNVDPKDIGLDVPQYKLVVKFSSGVERIAEIGVLTPTETGYYALKDGEIVIVDRSGIDALISLLTNPPYAETLTPSPIPAAATKTPLPSSTPEPATPTP
jgi:hypothetical protein